MFSGEYYYGSNIHKWRCSLLGLRDIGIMQNNEKRYLLLNAENVEEIIFTAFQKYFQKYPLNIKQDGKSKLFTKKEVASLFNVTIQSINEWMRKGILPFVKINSRVFFKAEDIEKLLTDKTFRNGK